MGGLGVRQQGLVTLDLADNRFEELVTHGDGTLAFDPSGSVLISASLEGEIHVGPIRGAAPHLLLGHGGEVTAVAVDPTGQWIASGDQEGIVRLWPMPQGQPFHTLAYDELLKKIRAMTNYRVVPDEASDTGYTLEIGPFPGWETVPTW
jgi:WD40 repeat protein